jgi:hypothetical protein
VRVQVAVDQVALEDGQDPDQGLGVLSFDHVSRR